MSSVSVQNTEPTDLSSVQHESVHTPYIASFPADVHNTMPSAFSADVGIHTTVHFVPSSAVGEYRNTSVMLLSDMLYAESLKGERLGVRGGGHLKTKVVEVRTTYRNSDEKRKTIKKY